MPWSHTRSQVGAPERWPSFGRVFYQARDHLLPGPRFGSSTPSCPPTRSTFVNIIMTLPVWAIDRRRSMAHCCYSAAWDRPRRPIQAVWSSNAGGWTPRPVGGASSGSRSTRSKSSSAAIRLYRSKPQLRQRCRMTCSPLRRVKAPMGAIEPPHSLARSPGLAPSTCLEYRQYGQWLRCLPPHGIGPTNRPQWRHLNSSARDHLFFDLYLNVLDTSRFSFQSATG